MSLDRVFLAESVRFLRHEYLPKIRACLAELSDEDLWWRPNAASNAVGNLILHLAGNVRQWVVCGIGGPPDDRNRAGEFAVRTGATRDAVLSRLEGVVEEAAAVLDALDGDRLTERCTIQGRDVTVLEAVYHVVEHFAMHTGQIAWITKARTGRDLAFYQDAGGLAVPVWPGSQPLRRPRG